MSKKILYVFVEGQDDEKFINAFIKDKSCLSEKYRTIKCIRYGKGWTASKINKYIEVSIIRYEHDYIFLADADFEGKINCFPMRKKKLVETYNLPNEDRVWIVIQEIESWFLAGFDNRFCDKEKLTFKSDTEKVTKETFDKIDLNKKKKSHNQLIDFLIRKKSEFSFDEAKRRNSSLQRFYNHFELNC